MEPIKLNLELNLDQHLIRFRGYNQDGEEVVEPQTVEDIVLDLAAQRVAAQVEKDVKVELAQRLRDLTDTEIRERVQPLIVEAMARPFRRSNPYGEATGPETTLREEITRVALDQLTKPTRDRYGSDSTTFVQSFIKEAVQKELKAELKVALDDAKAQVRAAVTTQAAEMIQQTIASLAR